MDSNSYLRIIQRNIQYLNVLFELMFKNLLPTTVGVLLSRPGATYYYFESKESLVYEYHYKKSHADHLEALGDFLVGRTVSNSGSTA